MARKQSIIGNAELKELMNGNGDFLRPLVQKVVQEVLKSGSGRAFAEKRFW